MELSWLGLGMLLLLIMIFIFMFVVVMVVTLNTRASDMSFDMKNTLYHFASARFLLNKFPLRVSY